MYPSATLCRSQQAYHLKRAETSLLDNVRTVANKAALAWSKEAEAAELREARRVRTREIADLIASGKLKATDDTDDDPSENPDRILADVRISV